MNDLAERSAQKPSNIKASERPTFITQYNNRIIQPRGYHRSTAHIPLARWLPALLEKDAKVGGPGGKERTRKERNSLGFSSRSRGRVKVSRGAVEPRASSPSGSFTPGKNTLLAIEDSPVPVRTRAVPPPPPPPPPPRRRGAPPGAAVVLDAAPVRLGEKRLGRATTIGHRYRRASAASLSAAYDFSGDRSEVAHIHTMQPRLPLARDFSGSSTALLRAPSEPIAPRLFCGFPGAAEPPSLPGRRRFFLFSRERRESRG